ncbi:MAG: SPOR domain-containing protein [Gammaproteobacteria bacterium]|nr:SPOR domain-containing protein [Gammaproteobacteria bacterium]
MVHDFAKIKPEPLLEKKPAAAPPAWILLSTGLVTGLTVGVFGCFLFYLSGNVPPLNPTTSPVIVEPSTPQAAPENSAATELVAATDAPEDKLQLEFYEALPTYEVIVDVTPVEIEDNSAPVTAADTAWYVLQSGAYERQASADTQRARLEAIGLKTAIMKQDLPGQTLYLVQSGPFSSGDQLSRAETLLLRYNIDSIKLRMKP